MNNSGKRTVVISVAKTVVSATARGCAVVSALVMRAGATGVKWSVALLRAVSFANPVCAGCGRRGACECEPEIEGGSNDDGQN